MTTAVNSNLFASRLRLAQQQQILKSGNINESNISLFENTEGLTQGMVDGTCTDGYDDGKIGLWEGIKSFGKGAVKSVANMLTPKNILKGVGIAALNLFLPFGVGTAITGALIAGGAIKGGLQLGKGIYDAANANTDAEKRAALEEAGSGAVTVAMSVKAAKGFKRITGKSVLDVNMYKEAATTTAEAASTGIRTAANSIKSGNFAQNLSQRLNTARNSLHSTASALREQYYQSNPNYLKDEFGNWVNAKGLNEYTVANESAPALPQAERLALPDHSAPSMAAADIEVIPPSPRFSLKEMEMIKKSAIDADFREILC